ncbi:DNA-binding protein [Novosphingobium umbonatum]|uniref:DNA-binding protein n=1 Tax=Novosphingobium umbonatum TaxID=1908524 RepID=A0A3S2VFX3_9SPHN|nr:DNA-binding protein [Novosphingobium umbonatum]
MSSPALLTEKQTADLLNISPRSVRNARTNGSLPYVKIGRLVRYRREDINALIDNAVVANEPAIGTITPSRRRGRPSRSEDSTGGRRG